MKRESKLFPFFTVPTRNTGSATLRDALKLGGKKDFELIAVNARRGWWRRYGGEKYDFHSVENWVDNIRFGEGAKEQLPATLLGMEEEVKAEEVKEDEPIVPPIHNEL